MLAARSISRNLLQRRTTARSCLQRATTRACSSTTQTLNENTYHALASVTLEGAQDAYDELADDHPELAMEVEYSVRCAASCHTL